MNPQFIHTELRTRESATQQVRSLLPNNYISPKLHAAIIMENIPVRRVASREMQPRFKPQQMRLRSNSVEWMKLREAQTFSTA